MTAKVNFNSKMVSMFNREEMILNRRLNRMETEFKAKTASLRGQLVALQKAKSAIALSGSTKTQKVLDFCATPKNIKQIAEYLYGAANKRTKATARVTAYGMRKAGKLQLVSPGVFQSTTATQVP